jgi:hypothetical protein
MQQTPFDGHAMILKQDADLCKFFQSDENIAQQSGGVFENQRRLRNFVVGMNIA